MTHTIEGYVKSVLLSSFCAYTCSCSDSGMGDYGQEGIDNFVADHSCTDICKWLQLEQKMPLQGLVGDESSADEQ